MIFPFHIKTKAHNTVNRCFISVMSSSGQHRPLPIKTVTSLQLNVPNVFQWELTIHVKLHFELSLGLCCGLCPMKGSTTLTYNIFEAAFSLLCRHCFLLRLISGWTTFAGLSARPTQLSHYHCWIIPQMGQQYPKYHFF